jgi:carboxymethylenebutenolidase
MCFEGSARPPLPPIAGGAGVAGTERLVIHAADGNRFNAFSARAAIADAPGIMILPDVRGLHPTTRTSRCGSPQAGAHATAMDYFGRTWGLDERDDDFDHMAHVSRLTPDIIGADTAATLAHLRSPAGGGAARVYSVGFCMGGRISFNQAWRDHGLTGVSASTAVRRGETQTTRRRRSSSRRCTAARSWGSSAGLTRRSRSKRSNDSEERSTSPASRTRW